MKTLKIKWQRLVSGGQTCKRCGATEKELERAFLALRKSMLLLGIKVVLEKKKLFFAAFKKEPSRSNRIWIGNRLMEEWIGAEAGWNLCCDVCGNAECRTIEAGGRSSRALGHSSRASRRFAVVWHRNKEIEEIEYKIRIAPVICNFLGLSACLSARCLFH